MTSILKADTIQDTDGNNIINESGNTITIGASGDTISIPSGATIANSGTATGFGGITEADQWRVTATTSVSGSSDIVTSNWERADNNFGLIGTGMSESSGVFTFPSTGFYLVIFNACIESSSDDSRYIAATINVTTDNSSYTAVQRNSGNLTNQSDARDTNAPVFAIIDVTDTANVKVKFSFSAETAVSLAGASGTERKTTFSFLRLGDT